VNKVSPTLIGAFVVGAVILAIIGVLVFGRGDWFVEKRTLVMYFPVSVNGLSKGAPVKMKGVQIGQVDHIVGLFDRDQQRTLIEVITSGAPGTLSEIVGGRRYDGRVETPEGLNKLIKQGIRASLQTESMVTGQLYIELDFQPHTSAKLYGLNPAHLEIPTVPSAMSAIFASAEEMLSKLDELPLDQLLQELIRLVQQANRVLQDPALAQAVPNVNHLLNNANDVVSHAGTYLMQEGQLTRVFEATRTMLEDAQRLVQSVSRQVEPLAGRLHGTFTSTQRAMKRADEAIVALQDAAVPALKEGKRALAETANTMDSDERVLSELSRSLHEIEGAARAFRVLSEYLQRNPEALLRGKSSRGG
jgi:paraquat-inducible protein B